MAGIERKALWIGVATTFAAAVVGVTALVPIHPLIAILLALLQILGALFIVPHVVDNAQMFRTASERICRLIDHWIVVAAVTYSTWMVAAVVIPAGPISLSIAFAVLGGMATVGYRVARRVERQVTQSSDVPRTERNPSQPRHFAERAMQTALQRVQLGWLRVHGHERSRDGDVYRFDLSIPVSALTGTSDSAVRHRTQLPPSVNKPIAIALADLTGWNLETDWVRLREEKGAGRYSITVAKRNIMADVIPYQDDPTPTSITKPALVGVAPDGREYFESLAQHSRKVGSTASGKSSLLHVEIAHATRCTDAVVWVAGAQKLYDLVAGWVEPYYGTGRKPPIDWVANRQPDALEMMAAAMRVARWRQSRPMSQRRWRTIILVLDEFSFMAQDRTNQVWFNGEMVTATQMASALLRGAASGDVYVHFATQRSTIDHYGDYGGDVIGNIGANYAFRTKEFAEIGRLTGDYRLPTPTHQGEFWLLSEREPLHLKSPYIQSIDTSKPVLCDGMTVADVSWARRDLVQPGLFDAEGREAAGHAYKARYQRVDDDMMSYLTGNTGMTVQPGAVDDAYSATRAELTAIARAAGLDLGDTGMTEHRQVVPRPEPGADRDALRPRPSEHTADRGRQRCRHSQRQRGSGWYRPAGPATSCLGRPRRRRPSRRLPDRGTYRPP